MRITSRHKTSGEIKENSVVQLQELYILVHNTAPEKLRSHHGTKKQEKSKKIVVQLQELYIHGTRKNSSSMHLISLGLQETEDF